MKTKNNNQKKKWLKRILITILILILGTAWYEVPVTEYITISSGGKVKEPVKLALVTDLHSGYYGKDEAELIRMIDRATPDAVLMSGDIFDDRLSMDNARIFCEQIAGKYPCFYVTGNHEIWSPNENRIKEYLRSIGITVLDGTAETLTINGSVISFCGVDDPTYMTDAEWAVQLTSTATAADSANASTGTTAPYKVLLSHRPERTKTYEAYDFDLIVCGHAHGGQWRIPFTQMGVHAPNQGQFPRYVDGLYELGNGSKMVVSRGLARERMPYPRFFNHPEIVIITVGE
jgi:predicted MPP superfamily phosphohydrolase